jgi:sulfur-oxidizing protein SoxZ
MPNPIKVRTTLEGDLALIRILISHPMETGLRKDSDGKLVPAHFIQLVTVTYGDRTVLSAQWGRAISQNPYLAFKFHGAAKGGKLKVTWTDNMGSTQTNEVTL